MFIKKPPLVHNRFLFRFQLQYSSEYKKTFETCQFFELTGTPFRANETKVKMEGPVLKYYMRFTPDRL
ncbi:MAG: hypothetical protein AVO39_04465 [delta proteobacterium MLS_D]|nr:MAG: hypothetical protein AVO39_04465 [delta proteobacterium MLS_D]